MRSQFAGRNAKVTSGEWWLGHTAAPQIVALLIADSLLLVLACAGRSAGYVPNGYAIVAAHMLLVGAAAYGVRLAPSDDRTPVVMSFLLILIAGPLGALGIAIIAISEMVWPCSEGVLRKWFDWLAGDTRVDEVGITYEALQSGRAFIPQPSGPRRFADVISNGSIADKQALLGLIGLKYHHDYFPLLRVALRSPEAGVRAQAAAVFVKLEDGFRKQLHEAHLACTVSERSADLQLETARSLFACAQSGFIGSGDAWQARLQARDICRKVIENGGRRAEAELLFLRIVSVDGGDDELADRLLARLPTLSADLKVLLARVLQSAGRHGDLHRLIAGLDIHSGLVPADISALGDGGRQ